MRPSGPGDDRGAAGGTATATLFLAGDVMLGRGVDQILPHPCDPRLDEAWVKDARDYVRLAERASGPIARPVSFAHPWGDLLPELAREAPAARIANLETSVTRRGEPWPGKLVHYRVSPENLGCLVALGADVCALANNHALDYGHEGLADTLAALERAGIGAAGAGPDRASAQRPAYVDVAGGGRVVLLALGTEDCGIPRSWEAQSDRPGLELCDTTSRASVDALLERVRALDRTGAIVVASVHWGSNWGHDVPERHVALAHRLVEAGVDLVHGHSSHHPRAIEVHRGRLVLYGCGDFLDDYEGIGAAEHRRYRGELVLAYFAELERATGELVELRMTPLRIRRMRLERAAPADARWLARTLARSSGRFGTRLELTSDLRLRLARR